MPVEYFIRYKGNCYDVGTRLKFHARLYGFDCGIKDGIIERFINNSVFIRSSDGEMYTYSTTKYLVDFDKIIIEIIEPVYYVEQYTNDNNRTYPQSWETEIAWIWYVVIMVVGVIFNARLLIWGFATAVFFLWKNGFLNGGKK